MTRCVAAFDFDGTLAKGDSLLPFLVRLIGGRRVARTVLRHAFPLGMVGVGRADRDLVKEKFIAHALTGHPADEIHAIGEDFAGELIDTRLLPAVQERVNWHREEGHQLIMVSATLDVYLKPLAKRLGFDELLCTKLEILQGRATGKLVGVNVRAEEKARQLRHLLGADDVELWAYGNSSGDHEMLEMAQHPFWVDRQGKYAPWSR